MSEVPLPLFGELVAFHDVVWRLISRALPGRNIGKSSKFIVKLPCSPQVEAGRLADEVIVPVALALSERCDDVLANVLLETLDGVATPLLEVPADWKV